VVLNTYDRFEDFDTGLADSYWGKSAAYWAGVREAWNEATEDGVVRVVEEPEDGSIISERLMTWASEVAEGTLSTDDALSMARTLIRETDAANFIGVPD